MLTIEKTTESPLKARRKGCVRKKTGFILSGLVPSEMQKESERRRAMRQRMCRFEELEKREVLSIGPLEAFVIPPIEFGSTYYENDLRPVGELKGDEFQITWTGGAAGTELSKVTINLDKNGNGQIDPGEAFFDTDGFGVYGSSRFKVVSMEGIDSYSVEVLDGGQLLVVTFEGFKADGKFVFTIDVDEWAVDSEGNPDPNAIVEGKEFEGSILTGVFTNENYHELTATAVYKDKFDDPGKKGLDLHPDDYDKDPSEEIQTAAAIGQFVQTPKTGSLSGHVYEDMDNDGIFDPGEKGIAGVELELWVWNGKKYVDTGSRRTTDENGYYKFEDLDVGLKYRIVEAEQPEGYYDGKDTAGSLGGTALDDEILDIDLGPNDHGTDYNFGELKYGSLNGYVYEDYNCDGIRQDSETGIPDVELCLWVLDEETGEYVRTGVTTRTDEFGFYEFNSLAPFKKYRITQEEVLEGYLEGKEEVGSLGGEAWHPTLNTITEIFVGFDRHGVGYNFAKRLPASLSGYVYEDLDNNGLKEVGEKGIPNVEINLYIKDPTTGEYVWTERTAYTDKNGKYYFDNLDPCRIYAVKEKQPDDYIDGKDTPGSHGGVVDENDSISEIDLNPGEEGTDYNFGERLPSKISGYVFQDGDKVRLANGSEIPPMQELGTGELTNASKRISGVVLVLADAKGNPLRDSNGELITATTDENGYYEFKKLEGGTYSVLEIQPEDYIDGIDTPGTGGGLAANPFDADSLAKLAEQGIVVSELKNDAIIGIHVADGEHAQYNNFSEILIEWYDPPVDPPPIDPPGPPYTPPPLHTIDPPVGISGGPVLTPPIMWQPGINTERLSPLWGGGGFGGFVDGYTWHLSVLNGGYPRELAYQSFAELTYAEETPEAKYAVEYINEAWVNVPMKKAKWIIRDASGRVSVRFYFGTETSRPVVGDFNGDGTDEIAVYENGHWYIDLNGNGVWEREDLWAYLGTGADQPIVGDWDGDGKADIGIFGPRWNGDSNAILHEPGLPSDLNGLTGKRPKNVPPGIEEATLGVRKLKHSDGGKIREDLIDHVFKYGDEGDIAFAGYFSGTPVASIGVFNAGEWKIDLNGNGIWDDEDLYISGIGRAGDIPVVGDWTGDGKTKIGFYRNGVWFLDMDGDNVPDTQIKFGEIGDTPVVGDFNGDGVSQLALYRPGGEDSTSIFAQDVPQAVTVEAGPMIGDSLRTPRTQRTPFTSAPLE